MSRYWYTDFTDGYTGWSLYGTEQTHNAQNCFDILARNRTPRITKEAAAGIVGNFTWESGMNTGQWEHGYGMDPSSGFGLAQWTPSTKYSNYIGTTAMEEMCDGDLQMEFLLYNTPDQWSTYYVDMNTGYSSYYEVTVPILHNINEYFQSTDDPQDLAVAWMVYWERGANGPYAHFDERKQYAQYWYDNLKYMSVPIWLLAKAARYWRDKR